MDEERILKMTTIALIMFLLTCVLPMHMVWSVYGSERGTSSVDWVFVDWVFVVVLAVFIAGVIGMMGINFYCATKD